MKIKELLLASLALSLVACSNTNTTTKSEERDAMTILEEKREFYEKRDKEREKKMQGYRVGMSIEELREEKAKLKAMTPDERLVYKVDKAKANIDDMLEIAKKARQEELDVEETRAQVEEAIKSVTEEAQVEATEENKQEETK
ncbi:hypothetical protein RN96_13930 [Fusobacterium polymorphum]|uniref:Lipoprotein n=1 Tax=Fusobacterium nucleatum subsp. polymorphum TaxID=76857 RepID=A0A2B7YE73_FUSNP|nr:hypothetical protein [Fusobacterium polymorphum]PGH19575.1 hypothetical protein RN96_13930 [Fusobacterium polymorphum]